MRLLRCGVGLILLVALCACPSLACSCANNTPIQASSDAYRDRAVFTARVILLMPPIYHWGGKLSSSEVLAIVRQRYWGLPWYWPAIVVLDGRYPCDIAMNFGEEYLVSGRRVSFGVLEVNVCSRTQPLAGAEVDLRTLDGTHCAAPGGTILGRVMQTAGREQRPVRNATLHYRDSFGKTYDARSDEEGVYELRHLPAGPYELESEFGTGTYALGGAFVTEGVCQEAPISIGHYQLTGRTIPGMEVHSLVELIRADGGETSQYHATLTKGRFYFDSVAPGEYYLVARTELPGHLQGRMSYYYPGASKKERAVPIRVPGPITAPSYDFQATDEFPLSPVRVIVESLDSKHPVAIYTQNRGGMIITGFRVGSERRRLSSARVGSRWGSTPKSSEMRGGAA